MSMAALNYVVLLIILVLIPDGKGSTLRVTIRGPIGGEGVQATMMMHVRPAVGLRNPSCMHTARGRELLR